MISLGGTIGTGLFLASGASVANAGPGGALICYALVGIMVFFMMECLGEMVISYSFTFYFLKKKECSLDFFFLHRLPIYLFQVVLIITLVDL